MIFASSMSKLLLPVIAFAATFSISSGEICSYAPPTIDSAPASYEKPENNATNALSDADPSLFWETDKDEDNTFTVDLGCQAFIGKILLRNSFGLTGTG